MLDRNHKILSLLGNTWITLMISIYLTCNNIYKYTHIQMPITTTYIKIPYIAYCYKCLCIFVWVKHKDIKWEFYAFITFKIPAVQHHAF